MYRVHFQRVRGIERRFGTLDYANRRFLSTGCAAERQDSLGKGISDIELIADGVVSECMHSSAEVTGLPKDHSLGCIGVLLQPGAERKLRMGHSCRGDDAVAARIVGE